MAITTLIVLSDLVQNRNSRFTKVLSVTDSALTNKIDKNLFLKKLSRELTIRKNQFDSDYNELGGEKKPNTYGPHS